MKGAERNEGAALWLNGDFVSSYFDSLLRHELPLSDRLGVPSECSVGTLVSILGDPDDGIMDGLDDVLYSRLGLEFRVIEGKVTRVRYHSGRACLVSMAANSKQASFKCCASPIVLPFGVSWSTSVAQLRDMFAPLNAVIQTDLFPRVILLGPRRMQLSYPAVIFELFDNTLVAIDFAFASLRKNPSLALMYREMFLLRVSTEPHASLLHHVVYTPAREEVPLYVLCIQVLRDLGRSAVKVSAIVSGVQRLGFANITAEAVVKALQPLLGAAVARGRFGEYSLRTSASVDVTRLDGDPQPLEGKLLELRGGAGNDAGVVGAAADGNAEDSDVVQAMSGGDSRKPFLYELAYRVLQAEGKPLHYKEIATKILERLKLKVTSDQVLGALGGWYAHTGAEFLVRTGPGRYAVRPGKVFVGTGATLADTVIASSAGGGFEDESASTGGDGVAAGTRSMSRHYDDERGGGGVNGRRRSRGNGGGGHDDDDHDVDDNVDARDGGGGGNDDGDNKVRERAGAAARGSLFSAPYYQLAHDILRETRLPMHYRDIAQVLRSQGRDVHQDTIMGSLNGYINTPAGKAVLVRVGKGTYTLREFVKSGVVKVGADGNAIGPIFKFEAASLSTSTSKAGSGTIEKKRTAAPVKKRQEQQGGSMKKNDVHQKQQRRVFSSDGTMQPGEDDDDDDDAAAAHNDREDDDDHHDDDVGVVVGDDDGDDDGDAVVARKGDELMGSSRKRSLPRKAKLTYLNDFPLESYLRRDSSSGIDEDEEDFHHGVGNGLYGGGGGGNVDDDDDAAVVVDGMMRRSAFSDKVFDDDGEDDGDDDGGGGGDGVGGGDYGDLDHYGDDDDLRPLKRHQNGDGGSLAAFGIDSDKDPNELPTFLLVYYILKEPGSENGFTVRELTQRICARGVPITMERLNSRMSAYTSYRRKKNMPQMFDRRQTRFTLSPYGKKVVNDPESEREFLRGVLARGK